jgi:inner membrane protein
MSPVAHFIGSWLVAVATTNNVRDRRLVTLAGVLPDLDGVAKSLSSGHEMNFHYYQKFHHVWLHGWPGALLAAIVLACFAQQRWRVALGCLVTFHLHLLCDLLGSRGPSPADLWPICYGEPLFRHPVWFWKGQWKLDSWQNLSVFIVIFVVALWVAIKQGYSFVEVFSQRADAVVVGVLRKWTSRFLAPKVRDG